MSKYNSNFGEVIKKYWFYGLIGIIFIIFLFDNIIAIWLTVIFLIIFLIIYLPSLSFTGKLIRYMKKQNVVEDKLVAQKFKRPLDEIKIKMDQLSTKRKGKKWLIASLNNRYVFYNKNTIDKFKDLYYMGFNEKRIFDTLRKNAKIRTRAEINTIKTILISQNKLSESKISPIEVVQQPQKKMAKAQESQQMKRGKSQPPQQIKKGKIQKVQQKKRAKVQPSQQIKGEKSQVSKQIKRGTSQVSKQIKRGTSQVSKQIKRGTSQPAQQKKKETSKESQAKKGGKGQPAQQKKKETSKEPLAKKGGKGQPAQ